MFSVIADGNSANDVYLKSKEAIDYSRSRGRPSFVVFEGLPRRFGHAATDRQSAYMTDKEIAAQQDANPLSTACLDAISAGAYTAQELLDTFDELDKKIVGAFETAATEPKIVSRDALVASNSKPLIMSTKQIVLLKDQPGDVRGIPSNSSSSESNNNYNNDTSSIGGKGVGEGGGGERPEPMRKQMTRVYDEILQNQPDSIYIGEDVQHGGYYLVTDGLAKKYPHRVIDFPPDETSLVGAGMGLSQAGFVPIVEIPYAKYLDCAADMFNEAVITNWLTNGKQSVGMLVRLQGFDKGVFGGNFHTHNALQVPPGLDMVCYSNGRDYVRGIRFAMKQARAGRIVMSVDSTDLLNKRHLNESKKDEMWLNGYPVLGDAGTSRDADSSSELSFDEVIVYRQKSATTSTNTNKLIIVTYGNGLPIALQATMNDSVAAKFTQVIVVDCPYLSSVPAQLRNVIIKEKNDSSSNSSSSSNGTTHVLFADVCKQGAGMPLLGHASALHNEGTLTGTTWRCIGASPTYNPLSRTLTFTSAEDIVGAIAQL